MTNRPRLLVLTSTYPRWAGDPEPGFVHELAKRLVDRFDVTVLAPHAAGAMTDEYLDGVHVHRYRYAPSHWETLVNAGGIVNNLKQRRLKWLLVPLFMMAQLWATWRTIRSMRPDVIHAHWLVPQGLVASLLLPATDIRPALVVTSHGADLFALRGRLANMLKNLVLRRADVVTVVSEEMRAVALQLDVDADKVLVRPMGVDMQTRFTPDSSIERSRSELLFVGRLVEKKGLVHLIAVMPAVLSSCPDAHLTIAGFGPEEHALRHQVTALELQDKVEFIGAVPQKELPGLYRRAALFVAPFVQAASGDQEGLGLVAVEAVACGCPVLAGDVPAVHDVPVATVNASDHAELGAAIVQSLGDSTASLAMAEERRCICLSRFDWRVVADGYADLMQKQITNRKTVGHSL